MRALKIIAAILVLTSLVCGVAFFFRSISDFIFYNHTLILSAAVIVLFVALLAQYKQTSILRENERLYQELQVRQAHIERDLAMARNVQEGLLRQKFPNLRGCKIVADCRPAQKIGGDFYGVIEQKGRVHFFLGDVAGHGISSALVMALTRGLLQELAPRSSDPARILDILNARLTTYLQNTLSFITLFYACYDPAARKLTYSSAGQHPALFFRKGRLLSELQTKGSILGMFAGTKYASKTIKVSAGDKLLCYTDGFLEARDENGQELGESFFREQAQKIISRPLEKTKNELYALIDRTARVVNDDLSLLCFEVN